MREWERGEAGALAGERWEGTPMGESGGVLRCKGSEEGRTDAGERGEVALG